MRAASAPKPSRLTFVPISPEQQAFNRHAGLVSAPSVAASCSKSVKAGPGSASQQHGASDIGWGTEDSWIGNGTLCSHRADRFFLREGEANGNLQRDTLGSRCERGRETSRSKHGGTNSVRVRSTLGPCITETPAVLLTEPGPAHIWREISDDRARMRNGDLVV